MKKRIVMLLLAASLSAVPLSVSAAELPTEQVTEEQVMEVVENELEADVIDSIHTKYSEETSGMICITAIVPDNFGLSAVAELKNLDTGTIYNLTMYADNGYMDRCYVPEGNYCFVSAGISGDNTSKYSFDFPESDFYVEQKQTADYEIKLTNFDDVSLEIQTKRGEVPEDTEHVKSDFDVNFEGTGTGELGLTGEQDAEYDLRFKITTSGGLNEGMFTYSKDNGKTWSEEEIIPLSGYKELGTSGLTVEFFLPAETDSFVSGDLFTVYVPDPDTRIVVKHDGGSVADAVIVSNTEDLRAFNCLEKTGFDIRYEILKGGNFGTAVGHYSTDGGATWSDEQYVQQDTVLTTEDGSASVILRFVVPDQTYGGNKAVFTREDVYSITAVRDNQTDDGTMMMLMVAIVGILGGGGYIGYKKLKSQIPDNSTYKIKK